MVSQNFYTFYSTSCFFVKRNEKNAYKSISLTKNKIMCKTYTYIVNKMSNSRNSLLNLPVLRFRYRILGEKTSNIHYSVNKYSKNSYFLQSFPNHVKIEIIEVFIFTTCVNKFKLRNLQKMGIKTL